MITHMSVCEFDVAREGVVRVEPNIFLDYFLDRVRAVRGKDKIGEHFIAVTDPSSPLESRAKK
jgi:transaldolase/glucose-6-phosphate isomerase